MKWLDAYSARREARGQNTVGESLLFGAAVLSSPTIMGLGFLWLIGWFA